MYNENAKPVTAEEKEAIKSEMITQGFFHEFPKEGSMGYAAYNIAVNGVETVRVWGREKFEEGTTAGKKLKDLVYKFAL